MVIPAAVEEMDERHSAFCHASGEYAVAGERARALGVRAVQIRHALGFLSDVHQLRHTGLHAEGHLVLRNARLGFRVTEFLKLLLIDLGYSVEHTATQIAVDAFGVFEVQHGLFTAA